jgi:hypothetical protein
MFQRIVDLCRNLKARPSQRHGAGGKERRAWDRFPSDAKVTIQASEGGTAQAARVGDVSRGGIKLLVRMVYAVGDMIRINLPDDLPDAAHSILACVVQVRIETPGTWALGCIFCEELTEQELSTFGASRVKAPAEDLRGYVRFPCSVKATYERAGQPAHSTTEVDVENVSATGIGLLVEKPLELGSLLNLHLRNPARKEIRTILACVVHVTSRPEGKCLLGCNFIRELNDNDLKALF